MNTLKSINESFTKLGNDILEEAKISPEDKHDSDVIRGILSKMNASGRKKFSAEEKAVMKKYNLDFTRNSSGRRDNIGLEDTVNKEPNSDRGNRYYSWGHSLGRDDKVNYADKIRKIPERNKDRSYRHNYQKAIHDSFADKFDYQKGKIQKGHNNSIFRQKDEWDMKGDYVRRYKPLYDKAKEDKYKNESYLKESYSPEDYIWEVLEELYNKGYSLHEIKELAYSAVDSFIEGYSHPDPDEEEEKE